MTRIGASLDLRFGKDTLQFIDFLYSNGFDHIEVRKDNDYVYGMVDSDLLGQVLSEYDFTISYHAPSREFNLGSVNERVRQSCVAQVIRMGEYLQEVCSGSESWVNIHVGHVPEQYHRRVIAKAEENMRASLDEIAAAYEGLDTGLLVENDSFETHLTKFGLYPEAIWDILNQHPGFGMTFDIGHAHHSGIPPEQFIKRMGRKIKAAHLHDNNGVYDEHLAPGRGSVDFEGVLCKLDGCTTYVLEMKTLSDVISGREFIESLGIMK
ncbi:MAG: sugar phosphate isomerase/epimerase [Euryarchaeota archaeon]|nr:sugar phosphate isomerase/epimerase [Euryarchaeota archaeon]